MYDVESLPRVRQAIEAAEKAATNKQPETHSNLMNRSTKPTILTNSKPMRIRVRCAWRTLAFVPKLRFVKPAQQPRARHCFVLRRAGGDLARLAAPLSFQHGCRR